MVLIFHKAKKNTANNRPISLIKSIEYGGITHNQNDIYVTTIWYNATKIRNPMTNLRIGKILCMLIVKSIEHN